MAKKRSKFTRESKSAAKRRTFSREFKAEAVKLAKDTGKGVAAVAKDLGLSESSLYLWAKQHEIDAGQGPAGALTTAEKQELTQLRRENRELRMEREFLKNSLVRPSRPPARRETPCVHTIGSREEWPPAFWCSANP
jgi:transposase